MKTRNYSAFSIAVSIHFVVFLCIRSFRTLGYCCCLLSLSLPLMSTMPREDRGINCVSSNIKNHYKASRKSTTRQRQKKQSEKNQGNGVGGRSIFRFNAYKSLNQTFSHAIVLYVHHHHYHRCLASASKHIKSLQATLFRSWLTMSNLSFG